MGSPLGNKYKARTMARGGSVQLGNDETPMKLISELIGTGFSERAIYIQPRSAKKDDAKLFLQPSAGHAVLRDGARWFCLKEA